jgi:hypothetical protein
MQTFINKLVAKIKSAAPAIIGAAFVSAKC